MSPASTTTTADCVRCNCCRSPARPAAGSTGLPVHFDTWFDHASGREHRSAMRPWTWQGLEMSMNWMPTGQLRLQGALSLLQVAHDSRTIAVGEFVTERDTGSPRSQWSLTASGTPPRHGDHLGLRHVDHVAPALGIDLPGYTELDMRLAWQPRTNLEIALHGRNLLHAGIRNTRPNCTRWPSPRCNARSSARSHCDSERT